MRENPTIPGYAGPRLTPLRTIATFCRECFGGLDKDCTSMECLFFKYRTGTIEDGASDMENNILATYGTVAPTIVRQRGWLP